MLKILIIFSFLYGQLCISQDQFEDFEKEMEEFENLDTSTELSDLPEDELIEDDFIDQLDGDKENDIEVVNETKEVEKIETIAKDINSEDILDDDINTLDLKESDIVKKKLRPISKAEVFEELAKLRKQNVDEIISKRTKDSKLKYKNFDIEALRVQLTDISQSPLFTARIPRATIIIDIISQKPHYLTKDVTVKVHSLTDFDKYNYIVNKEGKIKYRVYNSSISKVDSITDLYRRPKFFTRTSPKKIKKVYDNDLKYTLNFNIHSGFNFPRFTNELFNKETSGISTQNRLELAALTNNDYIFNYGLSMMYENTSGSLSNSSSNYSIKSLAVGPVFRSKELIAGFKSVIALRLSVISDVLVTSSNNSTVFKLNESNFNIGFEKSLDLKDYGKFNYGFNYQRKWLTTQAQNVRANISSADNYDDSISLYIGHESGWIW